MIIVSYPNIGEYERVVYNFLNRIIDKDKCKILRPVKNSKETLKLGEKVSPNNVCTPFKYTLGTMISSIKRGANVIIQIGGGCRFGYYAQIQEKIIKEDLSYDVLVINLYEGNKLNAINALKKLKILNKKLSVKKVLKELYITLRLLRLVDYITTYIRDNMCYIEDKSKIKVVEKEFLEDILKIDTLGKIKEKRIYYINKINSLIIKREEKLKIGIVGELYSLMDPFSSSYLENDLLEKGYKVKRYTTASYLLLDKNKSEKKLLNKAKGYLKYKIGADGTESVVHTLELIDEGYDGVIHVKPFGCTPEINAMPILKKISNDYSFPIMFYTFDTLNSDTGFQTRIEAFIDMLEMRNKK